MGGWGRSGVFGAQSPVLHSLGAPSGRPQPPPKTFFNGLLGIGLAACGSLPVILCPVYLNRERVPATIPYSLCLWEQGVLCYAFVW